MLDQMSAPSGTLAESEGALDAAGASWTEPAGVPARSAAETSIEDCSRAISGEMSDVFAGSLTPGFSICNKIVYHVVRSCSECSMESSHQHEDSADARKAYWRV